MSRSGSRSRHGRQRSASSRGRASRDATFIFFSALACIGIGLAVVVVQNAAISRTRANPDTDSSRRLLTQIDKPLSAKQRQQLLLDAKGILRQEPLDVRAVGLLAVLNAQQGNQAQADRFMRAAFDINRRDITVNAWMLDQELKARRYDAAVRHADILMRRRADIRPAVYASLWSTLADPAAIKPLAKALAAEPSWRAGFFIATIDNPGGANLAPVIMAEVAAQGSRIAPAELSRLLARLVEAKHYEQAYVNWLLFIPLDDLSKLRNVYDGDFEGWPQVYPFTWLLGQGINGAIEPAGDVGRDGSALHVAYDGVSATVFPRQMLLLPPGSYAFTGEYLTPSEESGERLRWTVQCADATEPLGGFVVGDTKSQWRTFRANFTVPADCKAQWLSLVPIRGERRVLAQAWFDHFAVELAGTGT